MSEAAERALRALQSIGTDRPATDDETIPVAGTAVLVRDGAGIEVLMMQRPERGSFIGAWVFPGGRVEPADQETDAAEVADARRAAVRETAEEVGLAVAGLHAFSCWEPPRGIPKRIRTWFFIGHGTGVLAPSADEVAQAAWVSPADMLARQARGEVTLYPPTWVTLHTLAGFEDAVTAAARLGHAPPVRFRSVIRHADDGAVFTWEPDVAWDGTTALAAPGPRHRLETATLPWRYVVAG